MVFSVCGSSAKRGNSLGQVTYDRFFSNPTGYVPSSGAVTVPAEGIYLVNFYTQIDSGVPYGRISRDNITWQYYSIFIRYFTEGNMILL